MKKSLKVRFQKQLGEIISEFFEDDVVEDLLHDYLQDQK